MSWPWPKGFPAIYSTLTVDYLSAHEDFPAAKNGDHQAAARLVEELADLQLMRQVGCRYSGAKLLCVANYAHQANQIPNAFAVLLSQVSGLDLEVGVVKTNRPAHTGRGAYYRFAHRACFDGRVEPGRVYLLLDDVATQGGTLSELRQWVLRSGGAGVCAIASLCYTPSRHMSDGRTIAPTLGTLGTLDRRFGLDAVGGMLGEMGIYGGNPWCLTESEACLIAQTPSLECFKTKLYDERHPPPSPPLLSDPCGAHRRRFAAVK